VHHQEFQVFPVKGAQSGISFATSALSGCFSRKSCHCQVSFRQDVFPSKGAPSGFFYSPLKLHRLPCIVAQRCTVRYFVAKGTPSLFFLCGRCTVWIFGYAKSAPSGIFCAKGTLSRFFSLQKVHHQNFCCAKDALPSCFVAQRVHRQELFCSARKKIPQKFFCFQKSAPPGFFPCKQCTVRFFFLIGAFLSRQDCDRNTLLAMRLWLTWKQPSWQQITDQPTERTET